MKKIWLKKKWVIVLIHAAAWILLFSLPYLLRPSYNAEVAKAHTAPENSRINFFVARANDLLLISFFYLDSFLLIPKFFYKKRYVLYIFFVLASFAVFAAASGMLAANFLQHDTPFSVQQHLLFACFAFLFILACSIAYKTINDRIVSDNLVKERENENLKTELSLLRMQVSPHFMFNVLNNMVALARKKSDLLEPSLIKLSSLMRYMLYETGEEKVSLEKEIDYLHSYIDLQMQRFGKNISLEMDMPRPNKPYEIEPMLLIPFVENAFKHGTSTGKGCMNISLRTADNMLKFSVTNSYDPHNKEEKDKNSGIGLANVRRRLELLYPGNHQLMIRQHDSAFIVSLQIFLA